MPFLYNAPSKKELRRKLRHNATDAEIKLWYWLRIFRNRGLPFRRQYGVGRYVVDFYCPQLRLVIEVDGGHHAYEGQKVYDSEREKFLLLCNIKTVRFTNDEVILNIDGVMEILESFIVPPRGHTSSSPPFKRRG